MDIELDLQLDLDGPSSAPVAEHKASGENRWIEALRVQYPGLVVRDIFGHTVGDGDLVCRPYAGLAKDYCQNAVVSAIESDNGRGFPLFDMVCKVQTPIEGILYDLPLSVKIRQGSGRKEISLYHTTDLASWERILVADFPIWIVVIHDGGYTVVNARDILASDERVSAFVNIRKTEKGGYKFAISMATALDFGLAVTFAGAFRFPRVTGDPSDPYPEIQW